MSTGPHWAILRWLADRFVLMPTRHPVAIEDEKNHRLIEGPLGRLDVWEHIVPPLNETQTDESSPLLILKFPGTGGRAERSTTHPMDAWPHRWGRVWTVNPPGYGGSDGKASLRHIISTAEAVIQAAEEAHPDHHFILCGNSLGNLSVCYLASHHPNRIVGALMRNPPPLREVIKSRYPWWYTLFLAHGVAAAVPEKLSTIDNAERCHIPALFVTSELDRLVTAATQALIVDRWRGPKQQLIIAGADHADPIPESQSPEYQQRLDWLLSECDEFKKPR